MSFLVLHSWESLEEERGFQTSLLSDNVILLAGAEEWRLGIFEQTLKKLRSRNLGKDHSFREKENLRGKKDKAREKLIEPR